MEDMIQPNQTIIPSKMLSGHEMKSKFYLGNGMCCHCSFERIAFYAFHICFNV